MGHSRRQQVILEVVLTGKWTAIVGGLSEGVGKEGQEEAHGSTQQERIIHGRTLEEGSTRGSSHCHQTGK